MICVSKLLSVLLLLSSAVFSLNVPFTVKECSGVASNGFPVTAIVPLPFGQYQNLSSFRVTDASGNTVPAQFGEVNRWWGKDKSLRHIRIEFQPVVPAFTGAGTGITTYQLKDDGAGSSGTGLSVSDNASGITVITGPLKFIVSKTAFNIIDQLWLDKNNDGAFAADEKVINSSAQNGGMLTPRTGAGAVQYDASRTNPTLTIEESGPMRVVIRAEALTVFTDTLNHLHGWAVRIYAYAGKPYVKVDYQLQNSAKNVVYAWPLYFDEMNVNFQLNLTSNPNVKIGLGNGSSYDAALGTGVTLAQTAHDTFTVQGALGNELAKGTKADGYVNVTDGKLGVAAITRYFWESWPNGIEVDGDKKLSIQLWPKWDSHFMFTTDSLGNRVKSFDLYWLGDMQHSYKEMLLYFHNGSATHSQISALSKLHNHHPVPIIPVSWYAATKASIMGYGGYFPADASTIQETSRVPSYSSTQKDPKSSHYYFGCTNFGGVGFERRSRTNTTGGWPTSDAGFYVTGNPADYFVGEEHGMGEINHRPQWMAQYNYATDNPLLRLSENPYGGGTWRNFINHNTATLFAPYLTGTTMDWAARDDQHGWHYHVEESYYYTGNLWIKDYYKFIAEFRKTSIQWMDRYPETSHRGMGHMLDHTIQAFRVSGDTTLLPMIKRYISVYIKTKGGNGVTFRTGYMERAICDYIGEIEGWDAQGYAEAFQALSKYVDLNYNYYNFSHSSPLSPDSALPSGGTGLTQVDPVAWYYYNTGIKKYYDHLLDFVQGGIAGGSAPYGVFTFWLGQYENRFWQHIKRNPRTDTLPPVAVADLAAVYSDSTLVLTLTPPADAKRFHIVYGNKPISSVTTLDTSNFLNWWAAATVGTFEVPTPGVRQTLLLSGIQATAPLYAAIFTFDENNSMSAMSNLATGAVSIEILSDLYGKEFRLTANPNPFNPLVKIQLRVPDMKSHRNKMSLKVYSISGKLVSDLSYQIEAAQSSRKNRVTVCWNGTNQQGQKQASGIYIVRAKASDKVLNLKLVLAK